VADRSVSVSLISSDLERLGVRGQNFLADLHNYGLTELGTITQVREKHITRQPAKSTSQGVGAPASPTFWDPYLRRNGLTYSDEIWYDNARKGVACL